MPEETRVDVILSKIKNDKWLSRIIVCGIAFLALASFVKAAQETVDLLGRTFSTATAKVQYDSATREALISVARDMHIFLLTAIASPQPERFESVKVPYIRIKADLLTILVRNSARPLNDKTQLATTNLLSMWSSLEGVLRGQEGLDRATADGMLRVADEMLRLAIYVEERRPAKWPIKPEEQGAIVPPPKPRPPEDR